MVNSSEELLMEIGDCFINSETEDTALTCLSGYTECFDSSSITDIVTCLGADTTDADAQMQVCLQPYLECIQAEVQVILDSLPECMNTTVTDLGNCYIDNASACNSTCSKDDIPETNPYENADASSLILCDAFQSDIMDPSCEIVDCCQECITEFEDVMNCIAQDILDLKSVGGGECVLSCSDSRRNLVTSAIRDLASHGGDQDHAGEKHKAEMILGECAIHLETSAGKAGGMVDPAETRSNMAEGAFQACLFENIFVLLPENAESTSADDSGAGAYFLILPTALIAMTMIN